MRRRPPRHEDAVSSRSYFEAPGTVATWWDPLGEADGSLRSWMSDQMDALLELSDVRDRRVLDAATGRGRAAISAALRGARSVVAIDVSSEMLGFAERRAREVLNAASYAGPPITFTIGDVAHLAMESECVDVAFLLEVLIHLDEPRMVLRELHRVLAPGGALLVTINGANPLARFFQPPRGGARPASRARLAAVTALNEIMTALFGFTWRKNRLTARVYRSIFRVPVRPLYPRRVRRWLHDAGFAAVSRHVALQGAFPREHRFIATKSGGPQGP